MWPRPGWTSSTRRSPRSSEIADENVRSGTTTSVAATSAQRGSSSSAAEARTSAACCGEGLGGGLVADELRSLRLEHAVAERVVPVLVAVDGEEHRQAAHPPQVGDHLAGQRSRRLRVEDQQPGLAGDHRDVDVEPGVARDPHSVGHLVEACHPVEASTLGTQGRRVPGPDVPRPECRGRRADCRTTASSPSCEPSSRTTSPRRSRSAPRPWSSVTPSVSRPRPSATTWRRWRRRGSSPSRTPAPAGSPPTRATGCSSTA